MAKQIRGKKRREVGGFGERDVRNEAGLFLEEAKLGALSLFDDLFAEFLQLLLFGIAFLLGFPNVLYVTKASRVPSFLVQKLQRHRYQGDREDRERERDEGRFIGSVNR